MFLESFVSSLKQQSLKHIMNSLWGAAPPKAQTYRGFSTLKNGQTFMKYKQKCGQQSISRMHKNVKRM